MEFTSLELEYLRDNYHKTHKSVVLAKLAGHPWSSIKQKARKLGLSKPRIRSNKLGVLLETNLLNAYWWGFIVSDGHINKKGALAVHLSIRDKTHLLKLANYLDAPLYDYGIMSHLNIMDKYNAFELKKKLCIPDRKTYNPIDNINFLDSKELRLAFFIGIIDGDGSIGFRPNGFQSIRIVVHHNWMEFFTKLCNQLENDYPLKFTVGTNTRANTCVYMGDRTRFLFLQNFIKENKLPVLERKWRL